MTLHFDGFEQFANPKGTLADAMRKGSYETSGVLTPVRRVDEEPPGGENYAVLVTDGYFTRSLPWLSNNFAVGSAIKFSDRGAVMALQFEDDSHLVLWLSPEDGYPRLNDAVGSAIPVRERWYYYEIELDRTARLARLYINNRFELETEITQDQADSTTMVAQFGYVPSSTFAPPITLPSSFQKVYDDIYMRDGSRLGPVAVTTRFPTADELVQWSVWGKDEVESNRASAILSNRPSKELDEFIASYTEGQVSRFSSSGNLRNQNQVLGTGLTLLVRKSPNLDLAVRAFIGNGSTTAYRSADTVPNAQWQIRYITFEAVPTDSAASIKAAPFGVQVVAAPEE